MCVLPLKKHLKLTISKRIVEFVYGSHEAKHFYWYWITKEKKIYRTLQILIIFYCISVPSYFFPCGTMINFIWNHYFKFLQRFWFYPCRLCNFGLNSILWSKVVNSRHYEVKFLSNIPFHDKTHFYMRTIFCSLALTS